MKISEKQIVKLMNIARMRLNDLNRLSAQQQVSPEISFEIDYINGLLYEINNQQSEELKVIE